ncbi:hypothetical protein HBA55_29450 [Pseudomaricurvus alkylphenolicus]|uniref:hypothetical protein n=1 Tax=Pseudomaricurvus alkylphenolicus TaxID=1306991 RepID=UPI0014205ECC|nr:hypothetical protein [Pseudomaricurvus alkylphenolicus]NIB43764.1 hypothetical protein [Pseudomaricurvus alkylphenolicus]
MSFVIKAALILVSVVVLGAMTVKAASHAYDSWSCHQQWKDSGMEYKYTVGGGCLLRQDQFWKPARNYRGG